MDARRIKNAVKDISAERDPTLKCAKLASLCSALWAERGVDLVVVGGSAIEILTEGAYASGDLDMCHANQLTLPVRERQKVMGLLGAKGGPRNWQVAGTYVDLLGPVESFSHTPFRRVDGPYGSFLVLQPEDLLVERVLVSCYPTKNPAALKCARELAIVALGGALNMDWNEVLRVANRPEYRNLKQCKALVRHVTNEFKFKNPFDSH